MNKLSSLLAATLLFASPFAWAEADRSADLRYCLDLKSHYEIAKCAGEISPDAKGRPFSKEEVEMILSREKASTPIGTTESPVTPATASDKPSESLLPEKTESNSN